MVLRGWVGHVIPSGACDTEGGHVILREVM